MSVIVVFVFFRIEKMTRDDLERLRKKALILNFVPTSLSTIGSYVPRAVPSLSSAKIKTFVELLILYRILMKNYQNVSHR